MQGIHQAGNMLQAASHPEGGAEHPPAKLEKEQWIDAGGEDKQVTCREGGGDRLRPQHSSRDGRGRDPGRRDHSEETQGQKQVRVQKVLEGMG